MTTNPPQSRPALTTKTRKRGMRMVVVLFILSVLALVAYLALRPAVPFAKLVLLKPGMSREEVSTILGVPQGRIGDDGLIYRRFANPGWVEVYFDQHDKLDHINDQSGAIKDFSPPVSR